VPKRIWITSALPKNATGKIVRRNLPAALKFVSK
jgi:acyl-coenzyme A synthetase/AMP-(fatty) acid ligase